MKKIAVYGTLFILLFNTMGYYVVFKTMQMAVRREIKKRIKGNVPASELTVIIVADNDYKMQQRINWIEGHEFRLDDRMYDIVRTKREGDTTLYYCINDTQEEALFANLDKQVKQRSQDDQQNCHKRASLIKVLVHDAIPCDIETTMPVIITGTCTLIEDFRLCGIELSPPSPPPRKFISNRIL